MKPAAPDTLEEGLSPEWLTAALSRRFPGVQITAVEPGPVVARVSTNARFRIETAGDLPKDLSPFLCLKGYFGETGRLARVAGIPEASFYRDLEPVVGVRTLRCQYADIDDAAQHGVIITDDIVADGGTFLTTQSPFTPDQVADSLEQLAVLHGSTWEGTAAGGHPWLESRLARTLEGRGLPEIRRNFEGPNGAGVPAAVRDAERLVDAYRRLAYDVATTHPQTVIHGDTHVGNLYTDGAGRPGFLDWQLVQRGTWPIDVGYHIASTLTTDERRRHEDDLLKHYIDRLAATGVDAPSWEAARSAVGQGMLHGFFLWSITYKVEAPVIATLLQRLGTAVDDHDALQTG